LEDTGPVLTSTQVCAFFFQVKEQELAQEHSKVDIVLGVDNLTLFPRPVAVLSCPVQTWGEARGRPNGTEKEIGVSMAVNPCPQLPAAGWARQSFFGLQLQNASNRVEIYSLLASESCLVAGPDLRFESVLSAKLCKCQKKNDTGTALQSG